MPADSPLFGKTCLNDLKTRAPFYLIRTGTPSSTSISNRTPTDISNRVSRSPRQAFRISSDLLEIWYLGGKGINFWMHDPPEDFQILVLCFSSTKEIVDK